MKEKAKPFTRIMITVDFALLLFFFIYDVVKGRWGESPVPGILSVVTALCILATCLYPPLAEKRLSASQG